MNDFAAQLGGLAERFALDAPGVDEADSLPKAHLNALAELGLYGAFAPVEEGGLSLGPSELCDVVEELAAACLATTFVWIQHFRLLAAALDDTASTDLRAQRADIVAGATKGGVVLGGALPGPVRLRATPAASGWSLEGFAPWVSGWGLVDELFVAARGPDDTVVSLLLAATDQPGLVVERQRLAALNATATVRLTFESLAVDESQVLGVGPYEPDGEAGPGLRLNGSLALGVARRCCSLLGSALLDDELRRCRHHLNGADPKAMPQARARACELAMRAASALAVGRGSSSVVRGDLAERAIREAALLLTFGSRPAIRAALLASFGASDEAVVRRPN